MSSSRNPHEPYIAAVVDAMPAGLTPTKWWASDAETASHGETITLSAVITWSGDVHPDEYPDGLLLCWDLEQGWQYAGMQPGGHQNYPPKDFPLSIWAAPQDVAAVVQALLTDADPPVSGALWHDDAVMAAVQAWIDEE